MRNFFTRRRATLALVGATVAAGAVLAPLSSPAAATGPIHVIAQSGSK